MSQSFQPSLPAPAGVLAAGLSWLWRRSLGRLALAGCALLLSGCASTLSARVTTFQQWPAGVEGQSYRFDTPANGLGESLEYQTYRDMVRAAIGATGLVEGQDPKSARFAVRFTYGSERTQVTVAEPRDPFFDPYFAYPGGYGYYGRRGWGGGWGGVGYYGPHWAPVNMEAWRNTLTVEIRDTTRDNAEVYRSSAMSLGRSDDMVRLMPYLVRAIFDGFPQNNGQQREVRYRTD